MERLLALAMGIMAGILFGLVAIFVRFLPQVDNVSIAFFRLFIGFWSLLLILYFKKELGEFFRLVRGYGWKHVALGALLALHFIFYIAGIKHTTVLHAAIFVNTTPIQSLVFTVLIFRIKPKRREIAAVFLGFIGVTVITLTEIVTLSGNIIGDIESFLAATFEAFYLIIGADLRKKVDARVLMASNCLLGSIVVFLYSLPFQGGIYAPLQLNVILILLALGVLPTAVAHTLYIASVKVLKPYETSTVVLLEPITASLLALILFNEVPGINSIIGSILIATAIILLF